jgi:hypothetical protein
VRVRIDGVDKRVDGRRLMARLADTYRPLLESSRLSIRLGGQDVKPSPLEVETRANFAFAPPARCSQGGTG